MDERARRLLEGKNFANVSTLRPDGSVHSVFVWVDVDGERVVLNTAEGRAWPRNVERDPRVTVLVANQENPYEYVQIRGHVVDIDRADGRDHMNRLSHKYKGHDYRGGDPDEVRLKVVVEPTQVILAGG
jgi:PPOX class probable F420-dependent enzyme